MSNIYEATGEVLTALLSAVTGANQQVVAAVPGKKIRLLQFSGAVAAAANATFHDNTPTNLTPALPMPTATAEVLGFSPHGWGDTGAGKALQVDVSASTLSGVLVYQLIN